MPVAKKKPKARNRIDIIAAQLMQQRLVQGNASYEELAQVANISPASAGRWMRLMKEAEMVHITSYGDDKLGRPFIPLYTWGKGVDLARPGQSRTPAQRMASLRERRSALIEQLKTSN